MEAAASSIWLLFFLLEYETQFTLTALDWLNFNSDNYPARGGLFRVSKFRRFASFPNRVNLRFGQSNVLKFKLTNCLRGIRNAWHFQHAMSFVIKLVCGRFCSVLLTP
ncbi:hypothetical protein BOO29_19460 [Vibrio navarrensis]|nr:hypothetical protein [Vibrio navarrensis]